MSQSKTWHAQWDGGALNDPNGAPLPLRWGDTPDIMLAHELVDRWAHDARIAERLPPLGSFSLWWIVRIRLVHTFLTAWLPRLRALQSLPPHIASIVLHDAPGDWPPGLFRAVFPNATVTIASQAPRSRAARARQLAARAIRAASTSRRLARVPDAQGPRVLAISRARAWNGTHDTELSPALDALASAGVDVRVMDQAHEGLIADLRSWRTRPPDHLFGDYLFWRHLRAGQSPNPGKAVQLHGALPRFIIEGIDCTDLFVETVMRECTHFRAGLSVYTQQMPALLHQLGAQAVLVTDECGGELGCVMGATIANVPTIAAQHGCIHSDHLSYMYPPGADPRSIPLTTRTCVYGEHYRRLLTQQSIFSTENVIVTGQPQSDARGITRRKYGERGEAGETLRRKTLPVGCDRLLLLSSQELLVDLLIDRLLPAFVRSHARNYLVIRPHPREWSLAPWHDAIKRLALSDRVSLRANEALDPWLDACDIHLGATTTVLAEAALVGRPNILIGTRATGDWMSCIEGGVGVDLETFPSLDAAISHWLGATAAQRLQHETARQAYINDHFGTLDGRAGERIAEATLSLLRR